MGYEIRYKSSVQRDLKRVSKDDAKEILDRIETDLAKDPESNPSLKGKFSGLRRMRVGNYRVIYAIFESEVLILRIGHRREIHKKEI